MNNNINIVDFISKEMIDHIDFGCSKGGSLEFAKKRLGGHKGLGIDNDPIKVTATKLAGFYATEYDILMLPNQKLVRFIIMSHFLEHIAMLSDVKNIIRKACQIAEEFIYIQQPFFDADGYLFEKNFKLYWSDWKGHPNRITSLEVFLILRDLQIEGYKFTYSIYAYKPIEDSNDSCIHSINTPTDLAHHELNIHPDKGPLVRFDGNVFRELIILITFNGVDHPSLEKQLRFHKKLFHFAT
jgi:hypothetical protein